MNYKQKVGFFGEQIAIDFLVRNSYLIIDKNVKLSYKEIDIVAKIKERLVFVEVKTRTNGMEDMAESAINQQKIKNMKKAIESYVNLNKIDLDDLSNLNADFRKQLAEIGIK